MNHLKILQRITVVVLALVAGMTNRVSAQSCPESNEVTITIVPEATINITSGPVTICSGGSATITTNATSSAGTCTYGWQSSPTGAAGTWTTISGTTSTLNITGLTVTTHYRAFYVCNGTGCDTAFAPTPAVVTVNPVLSFTSNLVGLTECLGGTNTISVGVSGGITPYTYNWEMSTVSATGPWTGATGANPSSNTYPPTSTSPGTTYYRVTVSSTGGCADLPSAVATVVIANDLAATDPTPIIECVGGSQTLTSVVTGGAGNITHQWQVSNAATGPWSNAPGVANGTTYTPTSGATDVGVKFYKLVVTADGNGCGPTETNPVRVEIQPQMTVGTPLSPIAECINGTDKLVVSVNNGVGAITYTWQVSNDGGTTWDPAPDAVASSNEYTPKSDIASNRLYRVLVNAAGNSCTQLTFTPVTVQVLAPISIAVNLNDTTECVGTNAPITVNATGGVTLQYDWEVYNTTTSTWVDVVGANPNSNSLIPANTMSDVGTKRYRVNITSIGNNCATQISREATVVVTAPLTAGTQPQPITECVGGNLPINASFTGGSGLTYQWQESDDNGVADAWANVTGETGLSMIPNSATAGTKYYRLKAQSAGGGCTDAFSNSALVTIVAKPIVTAAAVTTDVCIGGGIQLTATNTNNGGTGTCTYQWQSNTGPGGTFVDIPGATSNPWTTPAQTTAGQVKYKVVLNCNGNGCCN